MASPPVGVLLAQLGTPDAPQTPAVRRFLREFLSDRRVVDLPARYWKPLLHGMILPFRSPRSAALYRAIWRPDGLSPLLHASRGLTAGLARRLGDGVRVQLGMRYGQPEIASALHTMTGEGIQRILIVPLFPQYSSATTASIVDAVAAAFARRRFVPTLRFAPPCFDASGYIDALAASARQSLDPARDGVHWIFSFHGLPVRYASEGDPYPAQCAATARLLARALGLPENRWRLCYQSRFGREPWLEPATAETLARLPGEGIRRVAVTCPGFVADCLETLEEIAVQGRKRFLQAGGETFDFLPCLNDHPAWIDALGDLVERELSGWQEDNGKKSFQDD